MTLSLPTSLSHANFGLHPGTKPLGKRTWRHSIENRYAGIFSSTKALGPAAFESLLERDFHILLCADPRVEAYAVQAHQLNYWTPGLHATFVQRVYTPDFVLKLRGGKVVVVEVKAQWLTQQSFWKEREPFIREAYYRDFAVPFVVVTEKDIRVDPKLKNAAEMLRAGAKFADPAAQMAVRDVLAVQSQAITIQDVIKSTALSENQISRSYAALMRLALDGEIKFDENSHLSMNSIVKKAGP